MASSASSGFEVATCRLRYRQSTVLATTSLFVISVMSLYYEHDDSTLKHYEFLEYQLETLRDVITTGKHF